MKEVKDMGKERKERKEEYIDAYLRHIHEGEDIPDLDKLAPSDRRDLEDAFKMLDAIAGIDADLVPNLEDDPVAKALGFVTDAGLAEVTTAEQVTPWEQAIATEIQLLNRDASVARDVEAEQISEARSDLVLRVSGIRIRLAVVQPEELEDPSELLTEADRVFFRFPETAAVAFITSDDELLTQLVESRDCRPAIEMPDGELVPPKPRRPKLPLRSALIGFLEDVEPIWDPPSTQAATAGNLPSVDEIAHEIASDVIRTLSEEGSSARTKAKKETWVQLGDREIRNLARVVIDIHRASIKGSDLTAREQEIAEDVA